MVRLLAMLRVHRRAFNLAAAAVCFLLLGFALYSQHFLGFEPCPLCIFQRIAVIALGVAFILAVLMPRARLAGIAASVLIGLVALAGAIVSAGHLRLQMQSHAAGAVATCGAPLAHLWEVNPTSEFLAKVFRGTGDCSETNWVFLAIPMPGWVLIWVLTLGIAGMLVNWPERQPRR
jgi:protein dithiol:quinone oxidoreductase